MPSIGFVDCPKSKPFFDSCQNQEQSLEEKRGVCDFGSDWILSRLGQHAITTVSNRCGQVVYVS
jgi:hypothetical protein